MQTNEWEPRLEKEFWQGGVHDFVVGESPVSGKDMSLMVAFIQRTINAEVHRALARVEVKDRESCRARCWGYGGGMYCCDDLIKQNDYWREEKETVLKDYPV